MSAQDSGTPWQPPFARFVPDTSSSRTSPDSPPRWVPAQENLLSDQLSLTWPKQGMWDLGYAYALPTSAPLTDESASSSLLPTPVARDDGKSPEMHLAMKQRLPGGPRSMITSLAVLARADFQQPLLPTPGANDSTGGEGETRAKRQKEGKTGGPALRDVGKLLPTPVVGDSRSAGSRNLPGSKAKPGVSLTDAVRYGNSSTPRLLSTPAARDAKGAHMLDREGGLSLGGAIKTGGSTEMPSSAGNPSSDDQPPAQLTIEDA